MGAAQQSEVIMSPKWQSTDVLFVNIHLEVKVVVPTDNPLVFENHRRTRYGCNLIDSVTKCGLNTVLIRAQDCTPHQAAEEYRKIVNKHNGHNEENGEDDQV